MNTVDEAALREAIKLLTEIDNNPMHPANDARHPDHHTSIRAYQELEQWVDEQQELVAKQKLSNTYMKWD
jgi:hypothetical protein